MLSQFVEWKKEEKQIQLKANVFNKTEYHPAELSRHMMFVGESGSGKTASGISPVLTGLVDYKTTEGFEYSMLVIDPKNELRQRLKIQLHENPDRIIDLNNAQRTVRAFEENCTMSISERFMMLFNLFSSSGDAGHNSQFRDGGESLLRSLGLMEEVFYNRFKVSLFYLWYGVYQSVIRNDENFLDDAVEGSMKNAEVIITELRKRMIRSKLSIPSYFEIFKSCIHSIKRSTGKDSDDNPLTILLALYALCGKENASYADGIRAFVSKAGVDDSIMNQYFYYVGYFELMLTVLESQEFRLLVDATPIPIARNKEYSPISVSGSLEEGKIILFTPDHRLGLAGEIVAKLLKTQTFFHTFKRENMLRPIAYVADEFHRYITSDEESGEHNFLDRCRSYRACCLLATQSFEALIQKANYSMPNNDGERLVNTILNNVGNKVFFRTSCIKTKSILKELLPHSSRGNQKHILDVRPLTGLSVGECYCITALASWGRHQIDVCQINGFYEDLKTQKLAKEQLVPKIDIQIVPKVDKVKSLVSL